MVKPMMDANRHSNAFHDWLDAMGMKPGSIQSRRRAAAMLAKSIRMVEYYEAGREIPLDTQYLMAALADGYRPRAWCDSTETERAR